MADESQQVGLVLEPHQVLVRPLVTEKGTHVSVKYNQYPFEVHAQATKADVKRAVEELWNVRVLRVRTQTRKGKPRRHRTNMGYRKDWKKAIVELHGDDRIAFF
ncbi:MAG: 50S ribosomal protein L23 [Planctomycetaceae bacterium]|nr:50S ribosomal protein L23 [Planctomycetaceae bacterium]